jgi:hypothetical protein
LYTSNYYFESHITIDPVEDPAKLKALVGSYGFRLAKLFMQKGQPSDLDSFMTAKDKNYHNLLKDTEDVVSLLIKKGYNVRRYKIENILLDVKLNNHSL